MFSTIAFILVVMLLLLAALDLFVGVSNDAANFLNSAVGTRIAPLAIIMAVASVGVLTGATFSSGMMEIARKGMLHPDMFNFEEILLIFASVMVADVILLNLFNSLGLPTSTTVSIIFELLGAATFASFFKVYNTDLSYSEIFNYIKLDRTATIVSAILLSVVIAFIVGMMVQFIARVLFSFRFEKSVKVLGGVFCGISVTAIAFFLIMKGAKSASFMKPEYVEFLNSNFQLIMWSIFFIFTILGQIMVFTGGNVFRLIILAGTFALAFSFAGNDLVNFVGVPLAALDSWNEWQLNGLGDFHFMMDALNNTSVTSTFWLFLSGAIMCLTLWTSKKARHVIQTSINLSSSVSGAREQFGASTMGRIITRIGLGVSRTVYNVMPEKALQFIRVRYRAPVVVKGEDRLPFDYLRASINLVVAAALISFATSLKLPLSTTYVTFMVAMGTSFADGAWDRESAVYRISGVITVIAGWFLTGISAFTFACVVGFIIFNLGIVAALCLTPIVFCLIIYSNFFKKSKTEKALTVLNAKNDQEILKSVASSVPEYFQKEAVCIERALDAFFEDNEFALRRSRNKASNISEALSEVRRTYYSLAMDNEHSFMGSKRNSPKFTNDAKFFFYLVFSNMREASKSVHYTLVQAVNHVANRHTIFKGLMKESLYELLKRIEKIGDDLRTIESTPSPENVESMVKHSKKLNRDIDRYQLELVSLIGRAHISMHSSEMYLTFLQCMRDMANRYVAVCMQAHALAEIVYGKPNLMSSDSNVESAESLEFDSTFTGEDEHVQSPDESMSAQKVGPLSDDDDSFVELPKSPAQVESEVADAATKDSSSDEVAKQE